MFLLLCNIYGCECVEFYMSLFCSIVSMRINATTKMTTPIEEKIDDKLKVRIGMVTVSDGKSRPQPVRLHLSMEVLRLQKEEQVPVEHATKPLNSKVSPTSR